MEYLINKNRDHKMFQFTLITLLVVFVGVLIFIVKTYERKLSTFENSAWAIDKHTGSMTKISRQTFTLVDRQKEYEHQVKLFLKNFYEFDQNTFLEHIDAAKPLMEEKDYQQQINKYKDANLLSKLEERDIITSISIKDVKATGNELETIVSFSFIQTQRTRTYAKNRLIEGTTKIMDTGGRSSDNAHACILFDYKITKSTEVD